VETAVSAAKRRENFTTALGRVAQPQFQIVCERPPAAFGGSPPHGACPSNVKKAKSVL